MSNIVAVAGPTASGKSALSLALCKAMNGELVSFDSMQVYRGLDVGTAKATVRERAEVPHHLIDICDPTEKFSAAEFLLAAEKAVDDILSRGKVAVLCGGTGLYLDSFICGRDYGELSADDDLRASLFEIAETKGNAALHAMLEELDPDAAAAIHPNNVKRVVRAIEICKCSNMTKTEWDKKADAAPSRAVKTVVLDFKDREALYARINARVDKMISDGLIEETRSLYERGVFDADVTAAQAIGYKEMLPFVKGERSLADATEDLKRATRRYAKRQTTWFRKYGGIRVFVDEYGTFDDLVSDVIEKLKE
ncbi:MAG: tRNA (adenosine(37)-N6)-dimethylallyltransferase MiaA [Clostridia bacterium]|nr:tRNA (adenosine(37)-N6)-dimethylallyltransferase MiaA [Clostridia bacterium]